jgi:uncharacterized protein DUF4398
MSHVGKLRVAAVRGCALAWLGLAVGCANINQYERPSPAQIAAAEDSIRNARAKGADGDERAAPFLTAAERQLNVGKQSLDLGDNRTATWSLARAAADGELSLALAERGRLEKEATTVESQLEETRNQTPAAPPPPPASTTPTPTPTPGND